MNKKLLIIISVLVTFLTISFILFTVSPINGLILVAIRTIFILVFTCSSIALIIHLISRLLKRTLTFLKCYTLAVTAIFIFVLVAFNLTSEHTTATEETVIIGNGEEQTHSSKLYYDDGGLKQEINTKVNKNTIDSIVIDYDINGNIIREKKFKRSK